MRKRGYDIIAKKADAKLDHVASVWARALGGSVEQPFAPLERVLRFPEGCGVKRVVLAYEVRSKLFASLFNLTYEFDVERASMKDGAAWAPPGTLVRYDAARARFASASGDLRVDDLECDLVLSRIEQLGITDLCASADADSWHVRATGLVGSSTWNLIPPVLQLIEPRFEDCVRGMELFRMVRAVLSAR